MKDSTRRRVFLSLGAGTFTALYIAIDTAILRRSIMPGVPIYAMVGGFLLLVITWLLGSVLGRRIDGAFDGYKVNWMTNGWVIATAFFGAALTIVQLRALKVISDPSVIVPVEQSVVLVLLGYERVRTWLLEREGLIARGSGGRVRKVTWLYAFMILAGSFLVTGKTSALSAFLDSRTLGLLALMIVLLGFYIKMKHNGLASGINETNFRLWWLVWMVPILWVYGLSYAEVSMKDLIQLRSVPIRGGMIVFASMFFVYCSFALELKARRITDPTKAWAVAGLMAFSIALGFAITLVGLWVGTKYGPSAYPFGPDAFRQIPREPVVWLYRFLGALAIIYGAIQIGRESSDENRK